MTGSRSDRLFPAAAAGTLLLVLASYANHFDNAFHFDDAHVIEDNLSIRSLGSVPDFFTDASTFSTLSEHQTYRPLLSLTYALDYQVAGGLDPTPFHGSQLLFHLLVGLGLFLLVWRAAEEAGAGSESRYVALAAAAWFCVHTANTETVNYLSSRSDILSTLGILGSFAVYLYAPGLRRFHVYVVPMLVGVLAKPPAVMFAPMFFAWILLFEEEVGLDALVRPGAWDRVWRAILKAAPALAVGLVALLFVESMAAEGQSYEGGERLEYLRTQAWVWLHYLRLFVVPVGLTADTDWELLTTWYDTRFIVGLGAAGLWAWAAVRASRAREWRPAAFGLIWLALGLLPSSSVFPLAEVANEHRVYLPFAGLVLAAAWTGYRLLVDPRGGGPSPPRGWVVAIVAVVLAAHGVGTFYRNGVWRTEATLWADVVDKSPGNGRAWMNYGLTQMEAGRFARARDLFVEALARWPGYAPIHVNLGIVTFALGDTVAADPHFVRGLDMEPDYAPGHYFYGRYLTNAGRAPEALIALREAVALAPHYAPPRYLLLQLYYVIGSREEVGRLASETLAITPEDARASAYLAGAPRLAGEGTTAFDQGLTLTGQGRHLEAGVAYRRHIEKLGPDADAYLNLGWSQAMLGFDALAALAFQQTLMMRPGDELAERNLAWVRERMRAKGVSLP